MSNHPVEFHDVTPQAFEAMKERLEDIGFDVPAGHSGVVRGRMIAADIVFDTGRSVLRVSVTELPPATTSGHVVGWVHDALRVAHVVHTTALGA